MATGAPPNTTSGGDQLDGLLLLTVEEAAKRLRLSRTLVYRLISSGQLESVKVGRLRRVPAECLPEYVAALRGRGDIEHGDGSNAG